MPALLESGPTPPSTPGQQPYWRAWSEPVPTRHLRQFCGRIHALQRAHEDPQGQVQHARHPQYPHTSHQVQTRTKWIEEEQGPDLSPGGQHRGRKHAVKLPGIEFSPFTQHGTCPWKSDRILLSAYTTHKADEISNEDKIFLRALGFYLQHLSRR